MQSFHDVPTAHSSYKVSVCDRMSGYSGNPMFVFQSGASLASEK